MMIGDTMETDIRGAFEAGMASYLVLSGSTQFEMVGDYVYQPTRILQSVGDLVEEIKTGKPANPTLQLAARIGPCAANALASVIRPIFSPSTNRAPAPP